MKNPVACVRVCVCGSKNSKKRPWRRGKRRLPGDQSSCPARRRTVFVCCCAAQGRSPPYILVGGGIGAAGMMYTRSLRRPLDSAPPARARDRERTRCRRGRAHLYYGMPSCSGIFIDHGPPDPPRSRIVPAARPRVVRPRHVVVVVVASGACARQRFFFHLRRRVPSSQRHRTRVRAFRFSYYRRRVLGARLLFYVVRFELFSFVFAIRFLKNSNVPGENLLPRETGALLSRKRPVSSIVLP